MSPSLLTRVACRSMGLVFLNARESISNPLEFCYAVNWIGLTECKAGWLKGTGVAELAGKHF